MTPFNLTIITPEKVALDAEVEEIVFRTTEGDKGVLHGHEKYAASLVVGPMTIKMDGVNKSAAVSGGIVKVGSDKTTILANTFEWAHEIDVERAKKAHETAQSRLSTVNKSESRREFDMAEAKLKRAINRISVAGK